MYVVENKTPAWFVGYTPLNVVWTDSSCTCWTRQGNCTLLCVFTAIDFLQPFSQKAGKHSRRTSLSGDQKCTHVQNWPSCSQLDVIPTLSSFFFLLFCIWHDHVYNSGLQLHEMFDWVAFWSEFRPEFTLVSARFDVSRASQESCIWFLYILHSHCLSACTLIV